MNDLERKARRSKNTRLSLVEFRLACCCGPRASEIAELRVGDVRAKLTSRSWRRKFLVALSERSRATRFASASGTACKVLGAARIETRTIHHGRRTVMRWPAEEAWPKFATQPATQRERHERLSPRRRR